MEKWSLTPEVYRAMSDADKAFLTAYVSCTNKMQAYEYEVSTKEMKHAK